MTTTCVCGHQQSRHRWPIDRDLTACHVHACVCDDYRKADTQPPGYQQALDHYWQTVMAGSGQTKAADQYARAHAAEMRPADPEYCCTHRANETPAGMAARCDCVCHR